MYGEANCEMRGTNPVESATEHIIITITTQLVLALVANWVVKGSLLRGNSSYSCVQNSIASGRHGTASQQRQVVRIKPYKPLRTWILGVFFYLDTLQWDWVMP